MNWHDHVTEVAPGADDAAVLSLAHKDRRVLLTFDRDFGELTFRRAATVPLGVVLFRFIPRSAEAVAKLVRAFEEEFAIRLAGYFRWYPTIGERPVRQRPMRGSPPGS